MSEKNKNVVRRVIEESVNKGDMSAVDESLAPAYTHHDSSTRDFARGPEGEKERIAFYRSAFPDLHFTIEDQIAEGETVVTRWTSRGTHKGDLGGIAPTNKAVTTPGVTISHFADGKIVESWVNWDALGLLRQLGAAPEFASAR